ncbi:MAG: hypothetical protein ACYC0V_11080 [Armatimonadota bacterium]
MRLSYAFSNIKESRLPNALFNIPKGYRKIETLSTKPGPPDGHGIKEKKGKPTQRK